MAERRLQRCRDVYEPTQRVLGGDEDIPADVRRELMAAAVGNGRISYFWLCDVYRRGFLFCLSSIIPIPTLSRSYDQDFSGPVKLDQPTRRWP